jgi:hypothetical protein
MTRIPTPLWPVLGLLLGAAALPALAGSLGTSSAAGGSSASSAASSASDSSSASSKAATTAEGPYRIIDVAELPGQPGQLRLRLQALVDTPGNESELLLVLPQQTVADAGLARGQTLTARARPYGTEFARADGRPALFLLISDDWQRELLSNPVQL